MKILKIFQIHHGDLFPSRGKMWQWYIECKGLCCPEELEAFCRKYLMDYDGEIMEQRRNDTADLCRLKNIVQGGYHELSELGDNGTKWIYTAVYGSTE